MATEEGWQPGNQLRAFSESSSYFGAFLGGDMVGGLQLVSPDAGGVLPCQAVWPDSLPCSCGRVGEVTVFAVRRAFRGRTDLFWPVCVELWRHCMISGMQSLVDRGNAKDAHPLPPHRLAAEVIGGFTPALGGKLLPGAYRHARSGRLPAGKSGCGRRASGR